MLCDTKSLDTHSRIDENPKAQIVVEFSIEIQCVMRNTWATYAHALKKLSHGFVIHAEGSQMKIDFFSYHIPALLTSCLTHFQVNMFLFHAYSLSIEDVIVTYVMIMAFLPSSFTFAIAKKKTHFDNTINFSWDFPSFLSHRGIKYLEKRQESKRGDSEVRSLDNMMSFEQLKAQQVSYVWGWFGWSFKDLKL